MSAGHIDREQGETEIFSTEFPIFSYQNYDFSFAEGPFPIGLKSTYPEELVRRIAAARISYQLQLRSIDYALKRYVGDRRYPTGESNRLDLRIDAYVVSQMRLFADLVVKVSALEGKRAGETIGEWTFLRLPFAIRFLLSCGHKGAFFESLTVARMIVEQVAWAANIDSLEDDEEIRRTSASASVRFLKTIIPTAGRLYRWLSAHAHWEYDAHIKAMSFDEEITFTVFATSVFKARILTLVVVLMEVAIQAFCTLRRDQIEIVFLGDQPDRNAPNRAFGKSAIAPTLNEVRTLLDRKFAHALMDELLNFAQGDTDIVAIAAFMPNSPFPSREMAIDSRAVE